MPNAKMASTTDICLPILKFSYATGVRSDNTIPWAHLSATDIFVLVNGGNTGQLSLRVVQRNNVLENVDIGSYVDEAFRTRRTSEKSGARIQVEELPIFGITKESLLAIRYRLNDGQARRLQIRLQTPTECRSIVTLLEQRGLEFQEHRPRTARPGTMERLDTASSLDRPLTNSHQCGGRTDHLKTHYVVDGTGSFRMDVVDAGSLSQASQERRAGSMDAGHSLRPTGPSGVYVEPQMASWNALQVNEQSGRAQIDLSHGFGQRGDMEKTWRRGLCVPGTVMSTQRNESGQDCSSSTVHTIDSLLPQSDPPESRPQTAQTAMSSLSIPVLDTLEHEIPPRREWPFDRPASRPKGSSSGEKPGSWPATAASITLPPVPRQTPAKETSALVTGPNLGSSTKGVKKAPVASPSASPLKRSFVTDGDCTEDRGFGVDSKRSKITAELTKADIIHDADLNSGMINGVQFEKQTSLSRASGEGTENRAVPSPRVSEKSHAPIPSAPKVSRMDELLYGSARKALVERSTNTKVSRLGSLADAPHEITSLPSQSRSPTKFLVQHKSPTTVLPTQQGRDGMQEVSLAEYASQSREDREAAMEAFFMQKLQDQDEAFVQLCEDVEGCWRRVALGL